MAGVYLELLLGFVAMLPFHASVDKFRAASFKPILPDAAGRDPVFDAEGVDVDELLRPRIGCA